MTDCRLELVERVAAAAARREPVYIKGGDSKRHKVGRHCEASELDVAANRGVVDYRPGELVVTARAGTPVAELQAVLREQGQGLACEPPEYAGTATLGGSLASNLSGPARPFAGSLRDAVLGVQMINGRGELLNFGGQVMKNVAGYDVARLQAGALGTLGVMTSLSLKVLPLPEESRTLAYEVGASDAIQLMSRRAGEPYPLTGACWFDGRLFLRLAGDATAVAGAATAWGGDEIATTNQPWQALREMSLHFFTGHEPLWRLSIKPTAGFAAAHGEQLIDWGGSQRWLRGERDFDALQTEARAAGGHASLFAGGDRSGEVRQALEPAQQALQLRLKQAFDPAGIFNPGRLYSWM